MPSLYHIRDEWRMLAQAVEDCNGELSTELSQALTINEAEFEDKAEAYCVVIREAELKAKMLREEEKRLAQLRGVQDKLGERLRQSLLAAMRERGVDSLRLAKFMVSRSTSSAVEILVEPHLLPGEVQTPEIVVKANKAKIRELIESGVEVPGARISESQHIRIL